MKISSVAQMRGLDRTAIEKFGIEDKLLIGKTRGLLYAMPFRVRSVLPAEDSLSSVASGTTAETGVLSRENCTQTAEM